MIIKKNNTYMHQKIYLTINSVFRPEIKHDGFRKLIARKFCMFDLNTSKNYTNENV